MCDSSGFSKRTHDFGILQFLAVMTRCYDMLLPVVSKARGTTLSHNADNILAVFDEPVDAVRAAVGIHLALRGYNEGRPEQERFNVCIGIDCGKMLRLADNVFGDRVNVAARLGEDIAGKDEIIVTKRMADRLKGRFKPDYLRSTDIGGRTFELYKIPY